MITEVNEDLVMIEPEEVERESIIQMSDEEKRNAVKVQNRGTVILIGSKVTWPEVGDFVSFYKNATTPIKDKTEYLVIHYAHVLCKIVKDGKE